MATSTSTYLHVVIDEAALQHVLTDPSGMTGRYLLRKLNEVRSLATIYCPVRTGRLKSSITVSTPPHPFGPRTMYGGVGTDVEYATWVHEGRGPVRPIRARVLHWIGPDGESIFRPYAGPAEGQPFLRRAMEDVM